MYLLARCKVVRITIRRYFGMNHSKAEMAPTAGIGNI